ncbi:class I SAM-dependent methyltransferase [Stenotrophomonas sp. SPM]|uniref:methyltransferase n=1 Tax=Stenotrophomonas sp. SPM TaxID=2170735 RepID=UPI0014021363|nr:class I SAM-dependent methyltransferase [Stenotrophomonas sp. SPM]
MTSLWTLVVKFESNEYRKLLSKANVELRRCGSGVSILSWRGAPDERYWKSLGLARLFETVWVAAELSSNRAAVSELFGSLSAEYGSVIDTQRNVDCYNFLINTCIQYYGFPVLNLLDVGCGDGLILRASAARSIRIVGYDLSAEIARVAQSRGLEVLSDAEFFSGAEDFDAVVGCYSMHYFVEPYSTIGFVSKHLKHAGVWAMNFHKNIMFDRFMGCLEGAEMRRIADFETNFGRVLVAGRAL